MRDIVVTLAVLGSLPPVLARPWIGIIVWSWLGYMNPHRLTWGFAFNMPFAMLTAVVTLAGVLICRQKLSLSWSLPVKILVALNIWMAVTTFFALEPSAAMELWSKTAKIQLMVLVTLVLIDDRRKLNILVWTIALSLGFYGVKGGIFTLLGGGASQVLGPEGTFFAGNTEMGLVLVMTLPLLRYLYLSAENKWVRLGLAGATLLTGVAILGTNSRGAFVGGAAMAVFLWLKSPKKVLLFMILGVSVPAMLAFMPDSWHAKMETISTYEEDTSAMGRIAAWRFATQLALKRPIGGGFGCFTEPVYSAYAPEIQAVRGLYQDAHSIYFQVLGNHGFVGLGLYALLLISTWMLASNVIRQSRASPELRWAGNLAAMSQVSLIGFMVSGAFLGLAYFDLVFSLITFVVIASSLVDKQLSMQSSSTVPAVTRRDGLERGYSMQGRND